MIDLTKKQIIDLAKTGLSQAQINSFKWGNKPNQETRIHSALIKAYEISEINNFQLGKEVVESKLVERVLSFNSIDELEKSNEFMLTGHN